MPDQSDLSQSTPDQWLRATAAAVGIDPDAASAYLEQRLAEHATRPDPDLDEIEAAHVEGVAYADDVPEGEDEPVPDDYERHYCEEDGEDWPCQTAALVARVRTAEAAREHWASENSSLWSWILALGATAKKGGFQDGGLGWQTYISQAVHAAVEDRTSRTEETAEEYRGEYAPSLPGRPWEPVPPTPEEADVSSGRTRPADASTSGPETNMTEEADRV